MELNLYGVASIKLDKLRGRDIRKYFIVAALLYTACLMASFAFPQELGVLRLDVPTSEKNIHRHYDHGIDPLSKEHPPMVTEKIIRYCYRIQSGTHDRFQLEGDFQVALERKNNAVYNFDTDKQLLNMEIDFSFFTTDAVDLVYDCELPNVAAAKNLDTSKIDAERDWKPIVRTSSNIELNCAFFNSTDGSGQALQCDSVELMSGEIPDFQEFAGVEVLVNEKQGGGSTFTSDKTPAFTVKSFSLDVVQRNLDHVYYLSAMKMVFVIVSVGTLIMFFRSIRQFHSEDLGVVQKWVLLLLIFLVLYNDPLFPIRHKLHRRGFQIYQACCESTFIALQLFFWILIVHSVASSEQMLNIDEGRFYRPKIAICAAVWIYLVTERSYLGAMRLQDPSYFNDPWGRDNFFTLVRALGFIILGLYLAYFCFVSYSILFVLHLMKKSYKYVIVLTIAVIAASVAILFLNGQTDAQTKTPIFIAQYALYNIYIVLVAYFYSPCVDSEFGKKQRGGQLAAVTNHLGAIFGVKSSNEDHVSIMDKFYEQELPELTHNSVDLEDCDNSLEDDEEKGALAVRKRRDLKRDPKEKMKQKLWDNIMSEAEGEDDSSDSDDMVGDGQI